MHFNFEIFKKHPYVWGGIAVVIFLYFYFRGSSSSGEVTTSSTPAQNSSLQQAELNAATQIQIAQMQSNAAQSQQAYQLEANKQQIQGAVDIANIQAQVQNNQTIASQNEAESANATQESIQNTAIQAQENIAAFANQTQQQIASLNAQTAQDQIQAAAIATVLPAITQEHEFDTEAGLESQALQNEYDFRNNALNSATQLQAYGKGGGGVINNLIGVSGGDLGAVQATNVSNASVLPRTIGAIGSGVSGVLRSLF